MHQSGMTFQDLRAILVETITGMAIGEVSTADAEAIAGLAKEIVTVLKSGAAQRQSRS